MYVCPLISFEEIDLFTIGKVTKSTSPRLFQYYDHYTCVSAMWLFGMKFLKQILSASG